MKLFLWIVGIAFFTSSADIFLVLDIGGTLRLAQIMMLLVIVGALGQILQSRRILWPRGATPLAVWCMLQALLLPLSKALSPSVQLYLLLIFTVAGVFAMVQMFARSSWVETLMKIYLNSFVFMTLFGAFQFVAPALHLGHPLIQQWIKYGVLPRLNGFSYEPSYFATYMFLGWIMLLDLRIHKARIVAGRGWYWAAILMSLVLFLSTSRTAWAFMVLEGVARAMPSVLRYVRLHLQRLKRGSLLIALPRLKVLLVLVALVMAPLVALTAVSTLVDPSIFLAGTGINNSAAHSLNDRVNTYYDTLTVIEKNPWIGRGIGGVPQAIGEIRGHTVVSVADLKAYWGFPVPFEVFAASGVIGFIPFLMFFWALTRGESKLIRENWEDERAKWLHALVRAFVFEWLVLLADQNLLRVYLWFHVTMLMIVGYNLRYARPAKVPSESLVIA